MVDQERHVHEGGAGEAAGVVQGADIVEHQTPPRLVPALEFLVRNIQKIVAHSLEIDPRGPEYVVQTIMMTLLMMLRPGTPDYVSVLKSAIDTAEKQIIERKR